jgi:hypothetical protein
MRVVTECVEHGEDAFGDVYRVGLVRDERKTF